MRSLKRFSSWIQTILAFYVFGRFSNLSFEQIHFLYEHFRPKTRREKRLMLRIIKHSRHKLWQRF